MIEPTLFFGLPFESEPGIQIDALEETLKKLYINDEEGHLIELTIDKERYLGKKVGNIIDLPHLALLESNIYTLLKKLLPDYPIEDYPLYLVTINNE